MSASPPPSTSTSAPKLLRTMGLFSLVVYGVGDMIGSGIYGTVGKAAGTLGNAVWLAFVVSMVAAILTGLTGIEKIPRFGNPDSEKICTSHVERFNLTVRMTLRRFTRLTNAHSKSPKHHVAMQAIFFAFYNFARKHETLKGRTPAMAAGLADKVWTIREMLELAAAV